MLSHEISHKTDGAAGGQEIVDDGDTGSKLDETTEVEFWREACMLHSVDLGHVAPDNIRTELIADQFRKRSPKCLRPNDDVGRVLRYSARNLLSDIAHQGYVVRSSAHVDVTGSVHATRKHKVLMGQNGLRVSEPLQDIDTMHCRFPSIR